MKIITITFHAKSIGTLNKQMPSSACKKKFKSECLNKRRVSNGNFRKISSPARGVYEYPNTQYTQIQQYIEK